MKALVLLVMTVVVSAMAVAQPSSPAKTCLNQAFCEWNDFTPSGPRVTREWRYANETTPYKIEIDGASVGRLVLGDQRLRLDAEGTWRLDGPNDASVQLLKANETLPKSVDGVTALGFPWRITITARKIPVAKPGIATEDEPKLNLRLTRACRN